jgi:hypothetical protein
MMKDDMPIGAIVSVYWNSRMDVYIVQPMVPSPMGAAASIEHGEPTTVPGSEFAEKVPVAVLSALKRYGTERYDPRLARTTSSAEDREFLKRHLNISVSVAPGRLLRIRPLHRKRGGYVSRDGEELYVERAEAMARIGDLIRQAFQLSS